LFIQTPGTHQPDFPNSKNTSIGASFNFVILNNQNQQTKRS